MYVTDDGDAFTEGTVYFDDFTDCSRPFTGESRARAGWRLVEHLRSASMDAVQRRSRRCEGRYRLTRASLLSLSPRHPRGVLTAVRTLDGVDPFDVFGIEFDVDRFQVLPEV